LLRYAEQNILNKSIHLYIAAVRPGSWGFPVCKSPLWQAAFRQSAAFACKKYAKSNDAQPSVVVLYMNQARPEGATLIIQDYALKIRGGVDAY